MKHIIPLLISIGMLFGLDLACADGPVAATEKTQPCFHCKGTGTFKCGGPSCKDGQMNCSGPCLKPDDGTWVHMKVEGHPDTDVWKKFYKADGHYQAWNQAHAGEVVEMQNGAPVNIGKCSVCGGTTKMKCTTCKGTGQAGCPICEGKKVVPQSWTAFDNPKLKNRPTHFKLKDGRVLVGRKIMVLGTTATIKTEKDNVTVQTTDIVSEETPPAMK